MEIRTNYAKNKIRVSHGRNKWYVDGIATEGGNVRGFNIVVVNGEDTEEDVFTFPDPRRRH